MSNKQRVNILNANRIFIYAFALVGLFYDATWAYFISLTLWVWLLPCIKYECLVIEYFHRNSSNFLNRNK